MGFMPQELSTAKAKLESASEEQRHEMTDLAIETERQTSG
jgi:nicotinic acid mononucleotide adenylyltransferase